MLKAINLVLSHASLIVLLLVVVACGPTDKIEQSVEKVAIRKAIMDYYHKGHEKSDAKYYDDILHDEWKMFTLDGEGKLNITDKKTYYTWYQPEKLDNALEWKTTILYIDVSGHMASAKIDIETQKFAYEDYFNMMKIDGKWWIVHKMSRSK